MVAREPSCVAFSTRDSVVRGHHIYTTYWMELTLETEDNNEHDEHAVAVGHVPRSLSKVHESWFFMKCGGRITCRITGKRKLGIGLEVPCVYGIVIFETRC